MMDPVFLPYEVEASAPGSLHLRLNTAQKWLNLLLFRGLPFFLFGMVPFTMAAGWKQMPWFFMPGMVLLLLLAGYMSKVAVITHISLSPSTIEVHSNTFLWSKVDICPRGEIDRLEARTERRSRGGRVLYRIVMKDGRRVDMAVFPIPFGVKADKFHDLNSRWALLTGLKVVDA